MGSVVDGKRVGKHGPLDTAYLANRQALSAALGPQELWSIIDHPGLYIGPMTLARNLVFIEIARQTRAVPGDIVEFGCWKGSTLMLFAKLLHVWEPHGIKVCRGFSLWDQGFTPEEWGAEDNRDMAEFYRNSCHGELGVLQSLIKLQGLTGAVELYNGDVADTWPKWLADNPNRLISVAYLDMDLYRPTQAALQGLHERMLPGAIIGFDQATHIDWPGEGKAMMEFLAQHPGSYEARAIPGARQPEVILVKK